MTIWLVGWEMGSESASGVDCLDCLLETVVASHLV